MNINAKLYYAALGYYPTLAASKVETFMQSKDYNTMLMTEAANYTTLVEDEVTIIKSNDGKVVTRLGGNPDVSEQINAIADEKVFSMLLNDFLDYVYNSLLLT